MPDQAEPSDIGESTSHGPTRHGLVGAVIIVVACALGLLIWKSIGLEHGADRYPISWFIIAAAILGSIVNEPFRPGKEHKASYGWVISYIAWKAAIAIIFAFLLYLMTIGELIGGNVFPQFVHEPLNENQPWNMEAFLTLVKPASYKDIAKILIWSFLAGYSEKFVPNLIGQLLKGSEGKVIK